MRASSCVLIVLFLGLHVLAADERTTPTVDSDAGDAARNKTLIATVFDKPVYLEQVTPASVEQKRKELPPAEFEQWLRQYRGRRTYNSVWLKVVKRYVDQKQIGVTQEEMAGIAKFVDHQLASETEPPKGLAFTPEERRGVMIGIGRAILMDWQVCRSLHEEYGGRVGIGSLGAWTAFDGQNALIREHHEAGDIKFHHAEMEKAFWEHTKIKNFADAYPKGERLKKLLATPPYLRY